MESLDPGASSSETGPVPMAQGAGPSTEAHVADWVDQCLKVLSGDQREVWRLRTVEGLDYATIAQRLGRNESTVRGIFRRGLLRLKDRRLL